MSFSIKDWVNGTTHEVQGSSTTPISAPAIEDMETRLSNFSDLLAGTDAGIHNVKDYGAAGDASSDDTAEIQAAIDAAATWAPAGPHANARVGGVVYFPPGIYQHTGLDLAKTYSVTMLGAGVGSGVMTSQLRYTGTGARGVDARSAYGLVFSKMAITYNNAGFTGTLIDYAHDASETDASFCRIDDCLVGFPMFFQTGAVVGSEMLVSLNESIFFRANRSIFQGGQVGIMGKPFPGYANGVWIDHCSFDNLDVAAISNAGEGWTISNCGFEGTQMSPSTGLERLYYHDDKPNAPPSVLRIEGCWAGDALTTGAWIEATETEGLGTVVILGNFLANKTVAISATSVGGLISGNRMGQIAISGTQSTAAVIGNWGPPDDLVPNLDNAPHLLTMANGYRSDSNYGGPDQIPLHGAHLVAQREGTGTGGAALSLTATVHANAGTGGTASMGEASNDFSGQVIVTTGTGAAAGQMVKVTYGRAYSSSLADSQKPKIVIAPASEDAAACKPYVFLGGGVPDEWQFFYIFAQTNPGDAKTLKFNYMVAG